MVLNEIKLDLLVVIVIFKVKLLNQFSLKRTQSYELDAY